MLEENVSEAVEMLEDLLQHPLQLQRLSPFKAIGNFHCWRHIFPKGPLQWFAVARENNEIESNPFDLLCLCFITQLERKKMTLEEVLKEYSTLEERMGERGSFWSGRDMRTSLWAATSKRSPFTMTS
jgi:hypothetical protein